MKSDMLQIKIFGLQKNEPSYSHITYNEIEQQINNWLIDNQDIEIVSVNVSSGGTWTSGEKYYILYRKTKNYE